MHQKVRGRKSMTAASRALDNLYMARDNPRLLLACRIAEGAEHRRMRIREAMRRTRWLRNASQAAHQQQVGDLVGAQLVAIEDSSHASDSSAKSSVAEEPPLQNRRSPRSLETDF